MAKLLVLNKKGADYQAGDIIGVFDDSHKFGAMECEPDFKIVSVSGSRDDNLHLQADCTVKIYGGVDEITQVKHRRLYQYIDGSIIKKSEL